LFCSPVPTQAPIRQPALTPPLDLLQFSPSQSREATNPVRADSERWPHRGWSSCDRPRPPSTPRLTEEGDVLKKAGSIPRDPTVHDHFGRFAASASAWLGSTWAFAMAGLVVVAWVGTGPLFHFSDKWAMVISTGTSVATFLMVLLIQSTQNRDSRAINLKLNELIRAHDNARNQMIDIERLSDIELDEMQATYEKIKTGWPARPGAPASR